MTQSGASTTFSTAVLKNGTDTDVAARGCALDAFRVGAISRTLCDNPIKPNTGFFIAHRGATSRHCCANSPPRANSSRTLTVVETM